MTPELSTRSQLSMEEEHDYVHSTINLFNLGATIFGVSMLLIAYALVNVNNDLESWDGNNDTRTAYLIVNAERFRNGSYTYNFTDPQSGAIDAGIIDAWFANIVEGKHRYDYGNTFDNFCWNREIVPENEWLPSLFRSAQLFVSVQVPIRIAVLLSVTHRFIMLYAAARFRSLARTNKSTHLAAMYFLFNEMLYISSLFLYYSLHIWQDLHYHYVIHITTALALISFAVKMFSYGIFQSGKFICATRVTFGLLTALISKSVFINAHRSTLSMNCDQMVQPSIAICEYVFLFMVFASYALDIAENKSVSLLLTCTAVEVEEYSAVSEDGRKMFVGFSSPLQM